MIDAILRDIRYAWRSLSRRPGFTAVAILTFGVGIGLNTAVFSVVDRVLVRELPYNEPDRLVTIRYGNGLMMPAAIGEAAGQLGTFEGFATTGLFFNIGMTSAADSPRLTLFQASASLLRVLGVRVALGRDFVDDDAVQKRRLALLSYDTWRTRFDRAPDITGRTIAGAIEIVGVLPEGFIPPTWAARPPSWDGLLLQANSGPSGIDIPTRQGMIGGFIARLTPGVSPAAARADLLRVLAAVDPPGGQEVRADVRVDPVRVAMFEHERPGSLLLLGTTGVLLLLACANLSTLLLAHGRSRERAYAVTAALGGSRRHIMQGAVFEALLVCGLGTGLALLVLLPASAILSSALPPLVARYATPVTDVRVVANALVLAVICAVAAGLIPAWRASRMDLLTVLARISSRSAHGRSRITGGLAAVEFALAVMLATSALLLLQTFNNLRADDVGFRPAGLYAIGWGSARPGESRTAQMQQMADVLADMPDITSVAVADSTGIGAMGPFDGFTTDTGLEGSRYEVSASYFRTLGTPLLAGRDFSAAEVRGGARVAVVSRGTAALLWPGDAPRAIVGRVLPLAGEPPLRVVGVVPDFKRSLGAPAERPAIFLPYGLRPARTGEAIVRTGSGDPPDMATVRERIVERLAGVTDVGIMPVESRYASAVVDPRFRALFLTLLALAGLLLAATGVFAIAALAVRTREYELGVRLSYGATDRDIQRLVIQQAARPALIGLGLGLAGAWSAATLMQHFMYQIDPRDPLTYGLVAGIMLLTALIATWLPAWRAGRLDPVAVLRSP